MKKNIVLFFLLTAIINAKGYTIQVASYIKKENLQNVFQFMDRTYLKNMINKRKLLSINEVIINTKPEEKMWMVTFGKYETKADAIEDLELWKTFVGDVYIRSIK